MRKSPPLHLIRQISGLRIEQARAELIKQASVVRPPENRRAGVLRFFSAGLRKSLFPDVFGKGGNAVGVCGSGFFGWVSFLVLGLFHIDIVADPDGTPGVLRWRLDGI